MFEAHKDGVVKVDNTSPSDSVAVIVVNWNGWRHSLACLESLRRSLDPRWRLYLVDNASADDSLLHLSNLGDDVVLLRSPTNGGWTGGNNLGVRNALRDGYNFIFILNNDATVLPETIGVLRQTQQEYMPRMPILGPVHYKELADDYDFIGADIDPYSGMPRNLDPTSIAKEPPPLWETSYIRGAGLFVHRHHFETIGFFDDAYYLNYDETDWCFRARTLGMKSIMVRDAIIRHVGSASIGGNASPLNLYFLVRNGLLFSERHCPISKRLRLGRIYAQWAKSFVPEAPRNRWTWSFLVSRSRHARAFKAGLRDYVLRHYGNCPDWIREL